MTHPPAWMAQSAALTPLGPLNLVATAHGLAGAWFEGQAHHPGELDLPHHPDWPVFQLAQRALSDYFEAPQTTAFTLALDPQGSPFQQAVWLELLRIAPGQTSHYGAIAHALGKPQASRAVGAAVGRNPLSLFIPCHRVVGRDGSLTGYAGGLTRKQALLRAEGAQGVELGQQALLAWGL
ncbi:MAG: methylated-DNA--[protein]-cysteine S-methyltransferase [Ideonella sp.]|nr:methylated-DNA--[protein]-cysteine S-methyltransferase [Ideonella sp.]